MNKIMEDEPKHPYKLILNKNSIFFLFDKILCSDAKMNYAGMSEKAYECFEKYFIYANDLASSIEIDPIRGFRLIQPTKELQGTSLESLWQILLKSENPKIVEDAKELISQCYLNYAITTEKEVKKSE